MMLQQSLTPVAILSERLRGIGICGNVGLIAGLLVGFLIFVYDLVHGGSPAWTGREQLLAALLSSVFTWTAVLFAFAAFVRFRLSSVAGPSLLTCLLVSFATVYLVAALGAYGWAWLIGPALGLLIGFALCASVRKLLG